MLTNEAIVDYIIAREGGFVDHPNDLGGITNYGITRSTLAAWRKVPRSDITYQHMRELSLADAREIYLAWYLMRPGFGSIFSFGLRLQVVDIAVNHGVTRAIQWMQKIAGVIEDGVMGPITLRAINEASSDSAFYALLRRRIEFYVNIVVNRPSQLVFLHGWMARALSVLDYRDEI